MSNPPNTIPEAATGVFLDTLRTMSGGRTVAKLEDALRDATRAVRESGSKAKITMELIVYPGGVGVGDTPLYKLEAKIKRTLPEKPEHPSVFFADGDDNLTRRNPQQEEMRLSTLEGGKITKADIQQSKAVGQ